MKATVEAQAAMCVLNKAWTASLPLVRADPALNPNQPIWKM